MKNAETWIIAAHVNLLHMSIYSSTLLSMVNFGIHHALQDETFFSDPIKRMAPNLSKEALLEMSQISRELTSDQAIRGAQGACLIFAHAGCEAALVNIAKAATLKPSKWHKLLERKQLTVSELLKTTRKTLLQKKITECLNEFEREPLIRKTRILFRLFEPNASALPGYAFSEIKLQQIDDLRHGCAHGRCDIVDFSTFENDLEYLRQTGEYFIQIAATEFDVNLQFKINN